MKKGIIVKGSKLIDFLIELPEGYTLYSDDQEIQDLAVIDNFRYYYVECKEKQLHITECEFAETEGELQSLLQ